MRTAVIVQGRTGSSRLPGKALMSIGGRPLLGHVLERALAVSGADLVLLATSVSERDLALARLATAYGVHSVLGSEWDVLGRVRDAAALADAEVVMRVTGDCPLLAPDVASLVLREFAAAGVDYIWNDTARSGYPDGTDVEVFTREILDRAASCALDRSDREHVTPWMRRHGRTGVVACADGDWSALKLSVDTAADFAFVSRVHAALEPGNLTLAATLAAVEAVREQL